MPEMFQPRKNGMCKHCHKPVTLPNQGKWVHTQSGSQYCTPGQPFPAHRDIAFPDKTRVSQRPNVKHLFVGGDMRSACGILLIENEDELVEHSRTAAGTTCLRCPNTLKFRQQQEKESAMPASTQQSCPTCTHSLVAHDGSFANPCGVTGCDCRPLAPAYTKSRISGTNELPRRSSTDPVQQTLMNLHPDLCTAIYRDPNGNKAYCSLKRDHTGSCDPNDKPIRMEPTRRPVYCVHCQQYHSPDDPHRVSFDYPPIPYARELFESRQADLRGEMQEYIEGRLNQDELAAVVQRIEQEYVQGMHDLFTLRLI